MLEETENLYILIKNIDKNNIDNEFLKLLEHYDLDTLIFLFKLEYDYIFDIPKYEKKLKRIHQNKFRNEIVNLYNNRCIITGVNIFEACHIIPFCNSDYKNKYDKYNGILLKSDLHNLFDKYIFSINPNTLQIEFNKTFLLDNNNKLEYERFNNTLIKKNFDIKVIHNLKSHYENFLQSDL
jgi:predicted restriction endonuclease